MRPLPLPHPGTPPLTSASSFLAWQARRQWGVLVVAILLGVVTFLAQAVTPYAMGHALDEGLELGLSRELLTWAGLMLAAGIVQVVASGFGHRYDVENWLRAAFSVSQLVGDKVSRSGDAVTENIPTGEVVATVASDSGRIGEFFFNAARFIGSVVAYIAVAILMLSTSLTLGIIVAVGLPAVAAILGLLVKPLQARQTAQREASGRLTTLGADTVSGLRILRGIAGFRTPHCARRPSGCAPRRSGWPPPSPTSTPSRCCCPASSWRSCSGSPPSRRSPGRSPRVSS